MNNILSFTKGFFFFLIISEIYANKQSKRTFETPCTSALTCRDKSLMNRIKNSGPIILPCGTPFLNNASPDSFPRTWTTCFLQHRYERHQLSSWLATPYTFNCWWGQWCLKICHAVYRLHNATAYEMSLRYRHSVKNEGLVALFIMVFLKIWWRVELCFRVFS